MTTLLTAVRLSCYSIKLIVSFQRDTDKQIYCTDPCMVQQGRPSTEEFYSTEYPSIYREIVIQKDERGHYIDPFKGLASKPYGRRLMCDQSHPEVSNDF